MTLESEREPVVSSTEEVLRLEELLRLADESSAPDTSAEFDALLADDVLFVQPSGNTEGKSAVLAGHRPPKKRTFLRVVNGDLVARDLGDVVTVSCRTEFVLPDRSFAYRALRVWRRTDGGWKVAVVAMMEADGSGPGAAPPP